jgi:tRNA (guanosine-2'-O-)-methyltransferase
MDRVHKSHNFSAILRNCDSVGVLEAHVVVPEGGDLDLHHGTSAGTKKWIRVVYHREVSEAVAALKAKGFRVLAAHPSADAIDYREADYTRPTAITMGAELHGVSAEGLALADDLISIPMMGMVHSLNVSVASSLLLFEAARQRSAAGMYEDTRLSPAAFEERLFEWAYPTLARSRREEGRPYPRLSPDGDILQD